MTTPCISGVGFSVRSANGELASMEAEMRHLAEIGADVVEICATSLDLVAGGRIIAERAERLATLARGFPFRYTVHGLVCSDFMHPQTVSRQLAVAKALVQICDRIGARILVQHCGFLRAEQPADRAGADQREADALLELSDFAKSYGVRIALENIFTTQSGQYRKTPAQVAETVRALAHPNLVALIDFSHAYLESTFRGLDFRAELRAMAPVAGHLHVHDSFGHLPGHTNFQYPAEGTALDLGDLHMPLGWGDIPWQDIFSELTFLPGTTLMMEISSTRYRAEQRECLALARRLASLVNDRQEPGDQDIAATPGIRIRP
jgi:sugar phosphate isomerase/epimerase